VGELNPFEAREPARPFKPAYRSVAANDGREHGDLLLGRSPFASRWRVKRRLLVLVLLSAPLALGSTLLTLVGVIVVVVPRRGVNVDTVWRIVVCWVIPPLVGYSVLYIFKAIWLRNGLMTPEEGQDFPFRGWFPSSWYEPVLDQRFTAHEKDLVGAPIEVRSIERRPENVRKVKRLLRVAMIAGVIAIAVGVAPVGFPPAVRMIVGDSLIWLCAACAIAAAWFSWRK